ncbi:hypothetical protein SARC_01513 [Sphaeroforma arctica JP610]|uniref:Uncharacterized protein n=1 Tax=Sphaeroforma arctica JP610 TaxID=667725 RepID=A0A0L0GBN3_9EUKA|nr:hypothetical protein SARC_01513 [Sphaeroforma arctica JP610]KNC86319.1 hypothetical protein SARC_01513 [Sphaeroforma arctica JP610]|eukprot:XP_014160221.1 hypothetical protein SARC_01513 [Sphaeroforma arctica JP610]
MERDTREALLEAFKNAQIAGLDESWNLTGFHKVPSYFKAEKSTLDYIRDNSERLKTWTPQLQIEQICSHETQATVDPAFCKLAKGQSRNMHTPLMEQMTQLMENHRRARERCQTDADFQQNLLNHCIVQLLEEDLNGRTYERTLQLHPKWQLMETHELIQLLSPDIQDAQQRTTARLQSRNSREGPTTNGSRDYTNNRPNLQTNKRQTQNWTQRSQPTVPTTCAGCQAQAPPGGRHIPRCHHFRASQAVSAEGRPRL